MIDKQKIRQILDDNSNDSGDNCREFTRAEIDKTIEDIYNLVSVPAETLVMPKIVEEDFENMRDLFWAMLRTLEGKVKPDEDILDKRDVEAGYRIWNKIFKSNLKPRWED